MQCVTNYNLSLLRLHNTNSLLDFLHPIVFELVGSGDVVLGPVAVLHGVPVPDHHGVLSLVLILGAPRIISNHWTKPRHIRD